MPMLHTPSPATAEELGRAEYDGESAKVSPDRRTEARRERLFLGAKPRTNADVAHAAVLIAASPAAVVAPAALMPWAWHDGLPGIGVH